MNEDEARAGQEYAQGGYITGGLGCAPLHPDECLIKPSDYLDGRFVCRRPGHPTATSDCAALDTPDHGKA